MPQADSSTTVAVPQPTATVPSTRLQVLDVIRGVALCGIAFVNLPPMLDMFAPASESQVRHILDLFVQQRFFPIFSLLFGIGFGLMFRSAQRKALHPHRVMIRRIGMLFVFGILHQLLQRGEALLPYAIVATVLLIPASFLPPEKAENILVKVGIPVGVVLTIIGAYFGELMLLPGLFVLGYSLAYARVPQRVEHVSSRVWLIVAGLIVASGIGLALQWNLPAEQAYGPIPSLTGLVMATTYCAIIIAVASTPLRGLLVAVFQPLGRTALTNYIAASVVFRLVEVIWDHPTSQTVDIIPESTWITAMVIVAVMLIIQAIISALWLRFFSQGPLEKLWRWVTWAGEPGPANQPSHNQPLH